MSYACHRNINESPAIMWNLDKSQSYGACMVVMYVRSSCRADDYCNSIHYCDIMGPGTIHEYDSRNIHRIRLSHFL